MKIATLLTAALAALALQCTLHAQGDDLQLAARKLKLVNPDALERAVKDLGATFPGSYQAERFRARLAARPRDIEALRARLLAGDRTALEGAKAWLDLQRECLLANPLLDFDTLLLIRRNARQLGLPANWSSDCSLPRAGYKNEILLVPLASPAGDERVLFKPEDDGFVGDLDLHWDASRLLFTRSAPAPKPWQAYELSLSGQGLRQVTPDMGADVDNYDACYLPNGETLFMSTASMVAVPCVNGGSGVANLFRLSKDGSTRQLCFDQEHDWDPCVANDGRILYQRWEYADIPHANSRRVFQMNPDGTGQTAVYGSNGYWPTSVFYTRPIPGQDSKFVGIVSGHHGVARMGELVIFDTSLGQKEAEGAVQRIPGFGKKVERIVKDQLVDDSWPRFLHPYPLGRDDGKGSGSYFVVSCQPSPDAPWGVYLVDRFDNLLLLREEKDKALLEPIPVRKRKVPPTLADRVDPTQKQASVFISDIHEGPGLKGIPKGEVKALRIFSYTYGYRGMGGLYGTIGMNGPWDARRILGTVPVHPDGSASFKIPANTPIALQPIDKQGRALQLMRSWLTGMPGEVVSCNGCHEDRKSTPTLKPSIAARSAPVEIQPWHGPARGYSFPREVQPVLDAACVRCHNGSTTYKGTVTLNLRGDKKLEGWVSSLPGSQNTKWGGRFTVSYANLFPYLHTGGIESNMGLLDPMEFHASTSELVQMLRKGHFGVNLDQEQWERLATWIDLNAPFHGDWNTIAGEAAHSCEKRRAELRHRFGNVEEYHIEPATPEPVYDPAQFLKEVPQGTTPPAPATPIEAGPRKWANQRLDLGNGKTLEFTYIPAGSFDMGGAFEDEAPRGRVRIAQGYWMATTELTNELYRCFDASHDSGREHLRGYAFGVEGYPLNEDHQPVARVSWTKAMKFCEWLSRRTGRKVTLPTEAQWEYACRAGNNEVFNFGKPGGDFSLHANLSDNKTREFASDNYLRTEAVPIAHAGPANDYTLKDDSRNDGALVSGRVGAKLANRWGLHDMHGNVAEWTRSLYRPYPYDEGDGRNSTEVRGDRVVRGGSWRDRPFRAASGFRNHYNEYQPVVDVGIRVIIDEDLQEFPATDSAGWTGTALHPSFAKGLVFADSGAKALRILGPDGQLRTLMQKVYCYDLQVLRSGNILFCDSSMEGSTTREITQDGRSVWEYKSPGEVFSCQRLEDGSTLIAECSQSRVRIITPEGKVKHSIRIEVGQKGHKALRWARLSDKGELWVAQMGDRCLKAYDLEGKVLRRVDCGEEVFGVQALPGGELLFSTQNALTRITPGSPAPWKLTGADIPEIGVKWLCGFESFQDGSVLLCNWLGHGEEGKGDALALVDKDKRVLWKMPAHLKTTWVAAAARL